MLTVSSKGQGQPWPCGHLEIVLLSACYPPPLVWYPSNQGFCKALCSSEGSLHVRLRACQHLVVSGGQ